MCRKYQSSPRCRSELIDSAWVVIVPGQKCIIFFLKNTPRLLISTGSVLHRWISQDFRCLFFHLMPFYPSGLLTQQKHSPHTRTDTPTHTYAQTPTRPHISPMCNHALPHISVPLCNHTTVPCFIINTVYGKCFFFLTWFLQSLFPKLYDEILYRPPPFRINLDPSFVCKLNSWDILHSPYFYIHIFHAFFFRPPRCL